MKSRAAVLFDQGQEWQIEEIDIDDKVGPGELLIQTKAAGLCHSDEHMITGDLSISNEVAGMLGIDKQFPIIGGHEGAGEVIAIGEGVTNFAVGDHVSMSFIPSCGQCWWCSKGRQTLCDLGAKTFSKGMVSDGRVAHHVQGEDLNPMAGLGTFAEHMLVDQHSAVKIEPWLPWIPAALVSCGVATGWGSAVYRAEVKVGDTVAVVGCGGIGMNAVQGAKMAGAKRIIAIDPVSYKLEEAKKFGATHTFSSMEEATPQIADMTWGGLCDSVILSPSVVTGDMVGAAMAMTSKGGTVVVTGIANMMASDVTLSLFDLAMQNKQLRGTVFGSGNPRADIPNLLSMYHAGQLKLDELVTKTYSLDEINKGYQDMRDGNIIRGVITFD